MVDSLYEKIALSGVVLGDLFCQRRMFEHADFGLPNVAQQARAAGLQIIFQTPLYLTSKNYEQSVQLVRYLSEANLLDGVLLHDIGLLQRLKSIAGLKLWWDRHSYNRDIVVSEQLVDFLTENGVSGIEVTRFSDADTVINKNSSSLVHIFGPRVASFGRKCYSEYFSGKVCKSPHVLCASVSLPVIVSTDGVLAQYTGDGFTLVDQTKPYHQLQVPQLYQEKERLGLLATISSLDDLERLQMLINSK
jgi:hypothetical protein